MTRVLAASLAALVGLSAPAFATAAAVPAMRSTPSCGTGVACLTLSADGQGRLRNTVVTLPASAGSALITFQATVACSGTTGAKVHLALQLAGSLPSSYSDAASRLGSTVRDLTVQDSSGNFETQSIALTRLFTVSASTLSPVVGYDYAVTDGTATCTVYNGNFISVYTP